jgi:hypothetical protein
MKSSTRRQLLRVVAAGAALSMGKKPTKADPGKYCLLKGTMIATADGDRAVETLQPDHIVLTLVGPKPIKRVRTWLGDTEPIRVARGAIAEDVPVRDLHLSPEHCLFLDGALIPVKELVNDTTIAPGLPPCVSAIEYYHVEFETHEAILADGLWVESYREEGSSMTPFAPIHRYRGGREELMGLARRLASHVIDVRDSPQIAYDRIADRAAQTGYFGNA